MRTWLQAMVDSEGSDLHLKVGSPPRVRVHGRLVRLEAPPLTSEQLDELTNEVVRADLLETFNKLGEVDFAYSVSGIGRFRVNAFRQRGSAGMVLRRVQ